MSPNTTAAESGDTEIPPFWKLEIIAGNVVLGLINGRAFAFRWSWQSSGREGAMNRGFALGSHCTCGACGVMIGSSCLLHTTTNTPNRLIRQHHPNSGPPEPAKMEDDDFDLPNAEQYFEALLQPKPAAVIPQSWQVELDNGEHDGNTAATHACLGLPELLERVMLFVPPLKVYELQLVSSLWRDLITRSIPIRRHIYFVPERYSVSNDLNTLLQSKPGWGMTRLGSALNPFQCQLYAHKDKIGVRIEVFSGEPVLRL